ncbi:MAG: response regulator [Nitrospira sp.]|jgi:DNA-binding NtrC family response regulator|nr:response regulator [Nitrospira sp.]
MAEAQSPPAAPTILVVDDDSSMVSLCRQFLEQAGFTVLGAEGSREALKICTQHQGPIDLLLTDLFLPPPDFEMATSTNAFPHVNGNVLAVKAAAIRKGLRIVLMSAVSEEELSKHAIKHGGLPFLHKPLKKDILLHAIRDTLQNPPPALTADSGNASGDVAWFD